MAILKQSTVYTRTFLMVQTSDHISGITGATVTVNISKAGATGAAAAGAVSEVDSTHNPGLYKVALTTADTGTLGDLSFHCTATSADPTDFVDQVTTQILGDTLTANTTQLAGQTVTAAAGVTFPSSVSSPTNITAGTITTATNLTNAPTAGDFTATMKTSIGTAVAASAVASVTGAVASVTGNVGGNVTGSVGSVVGAVGSVTGNVGGSVGSVTGAVGSVTGNVGGNVTGSVASVTAAVTVDGTSALTEAYPAQGGALTLAKALYSMHQLMAQQSVVATTLTTKKRDGTTVAKTFTLNDATTPTAISEAT